MVKKTKFITVKNGAQIEVIDAPASELEHLSSVVYLIVHRKTKMVYVGITERTLKGRWYTGYDPVDQFIGRALQKYGEDAFDKYVVAKTCKSRRSLNKLERQLIKLCGGHKSDWTYNILPGGGNLPYRGVPIIAVNLTTGQEREFKSASDANRILGVSATCVNRICGGRLKSAKDKKQQPWWFRWKHDTAAKPPTKFGSGINLKERSYAIEAFNLTTGESRDFFGCPEISKELGVSYKLIGVIINGHRTSATDKNGDSWWFRRSGDLTKPPTEWGRTNKSLRKSIIVIPYADRRKRLHFASLGEAVTALGGKSRVTICRVASGHIKSFSANGEYYWATYDIKNIDQMPKEYGDQSRAKSRGIPVTATHIKSGKQRIFSGQSEAGRKLSVQQSRISNAVKFNRLVGNYRFAYA